MTVAVWVGYPDRLKPMETEWRGEPVAGGTYPAAIWRQFMLGTRALFAKQKLEKQCEDEDAKKTERCRRPGLGDVPTTTTPVPAPGTATTPERRRRRRTDRRPRTTGTPDGGGVAPTTSTPTPTPTPTPETPAQPAPATPTPAQPTPQTPDPAGGAAPSAGGATPGTG